MRASGSTAHDFVRVAEVPVLGLGIDFGTSNSTVACYDGETVALLPLDPAADAPQVTPTALYLDRERRGRVGQQAIDTYLRENAGRNVTLEREEIGEIEITTSGGELIQGPKQDGGAITTPVRLHAFTDRGLPGRLFRGLKRWLGNEDLDRVSVFGRRYRIVALVTPILKQLADATADSHPELTHEISALRRDGSALRRDGSALRRDGSALRRDVCVGRPVHFEGGAIRAAVAQERVDVAQERAAVAQERIDEIAVERLQEACDYAGLGAARLFPEPVAAALSFLHTQPLERGAVLAFDFGGGTLDLTLLRCAGGELEILATHGAALGGDGIDRLVYREKVFPALGRGVLVPNTLATELLRFDFGLFEDRLLNWPMAYDLNRPELRELIRHGMRAGGNAARKLGRLLELVQRNQAYRVCRAIERAKLRLSSHEQAWIEVPELDLRLSIERAEFERIIAPVLAGIEDCVERALKRAGLTAPDVDRVVRTGGSSQIPAVRDALERRFPGRVVEHGVFTSIAAGLAIASYRGEPSPLEGSSRPRDRGPR